MSKASDFTSAFRPAEGSIVIESQGPVSSGNAGIAGLGTAGVYWADGEIALVFEASTMPLANSSVRDGSQAVPYPVAALASTDKHMPEFLWLNNQAATVAKGGIQHIGKR